MLFRSGSSLTGKGIDELWQVVAQRVAAARADGRLQQRRERQLQQWLDATVRQALLDDFFLDPRVQQALPGLRAAVAAGQELPQAAARALLAARSAKG